MTKSYNLTELETRLQEAYDSYKQRPDSSESKTELFLSIKELAFAILDIQSKRKTRFAQIDKDLMAYEYSVYLYQRIVEGKFVLPDLEGREKFAWHQYIQLNLLHIIYQDLDDLDTREELSVEDINCIVNFNDIEEHLKLEDDEGKDDSLRIQIKREEAEHLLDLLASFYSKDDIERYLVLVNSLSKPRWKNVDGLDEFIKLLTIIYKRLYEQVELPLDDPDLDSILKSTLFLASILSSGLDRRLFVSLDLWNLCRLAILCGGEKIEIPTIQEVEDLVASAFTVWKAIKDQKDLDITKQEVKKFIFRSTRLTRLDNYLRNMSKFLSFVPEEDTKSKDKEPVIKLLLSIITSLSIVSQKTLEEVERLASSEDNLPRLVSIYKELATMAETLQATVFNIKDFLRKGN